MGELAAVLLTVFIILLVLAWLLPHIHRFSDGRWEWVSMEDWKKEDWKREDPSD